MTVNGAKSDPRTRRTVLVSMRAVLPELAASERRIASYFLNDAASALELSIAELAEKCGTSTTSVVRFFKRLGYERFKDLLMDVMSEITREEVETASHLEVSGDIARDDSVADIIAKVSLAETLSLSDTAAALDPELLRAAILKVASSRRVDIFGLGASSFVGLDLQQKLTRIGRTALNWADSHAAWTSAATLEPDCVVIAVSHSGTTLDTIEFLEIAKKMGVTTIALTNHGSSALAERADIVLTTAARETGFRSGALGSRIAQLMVVDCLFIGVAQQNYDRSMAALRNTYAAVQGGRALRP